MRDGNLALAAISSFKTGDRPIIPVNVRDAKGNNQQVPFLVDWGNDNTIITESTRQQLGLKPNGSTQVKGVNGPPASYGIIPDFQLQIGSTRPMKTQAFSGNSPMNLLGWKDVLKNFDMAYKDNNLRLVQKTDCMVCI